MIYKEFFNSSVDYLVRYAHENNLQSYILGVSGGIDSTVVAAIASEACKKAGIPLIGRSLPSSTNEEEEKNAASLVGSAFCTNFKTVNINHKVNMLKEALDVIEGPVTSLQFGNIKARVRMIYLYHLASVHKGCVLDTDNRTEHELGFWTIHGDVGDVNCGLIYLWKTMVFELARFLHNYYKELGQQNKVLALEHSLELTPTDGNGVMEGGDCAQFGLDNYAQVDDVLETMYCRSGFEQAFSPNSDQYIRLIEDYNEQGVDKVMVLHQNSEFKRKALPIHPSVEELNLV